MRCIKNSPAVLDFYLNAVASFPAHLTYTCVWACTHAKYLTGKVVNQINRVETFPDWLKCCTCFCTEPGTVTVALTVENIRAVNMSA